MAGVVGLLAVLWVSGFLWMRGEQLTPASAPGTTATPSAAPSSSPSPEPTPRGSTAASGPTRAADPREPREKPDRQAVPAVPSSLLEEITRGLEPPAPPVVETVVASFNLLGSSHTSAGGNRPGYAPGPRRVAGALQLLDRERVSLVGLQEVQDIQHRAFASAPGWETHPRVGGGRAAGQNVVAWRTAQWELVQPGSVAIPYFFGNVKQMPYALLRHRETGVLTYLSTFHNPASTPRVGDQKRWRERAKSLQVDLFKELRATGIPHLVTGDFNERDPYFCQVTAATGFTSPAGGSNEAGCRPPADAKIDWVFGDREIEWTGYAAVRDDLVRRTTDHSVIVAGARIDAGDFPRSWAAPES